MLTLLLALSLSASAAGTAAVNIERVEAIGLGAAERAELKQRLVGELELMGATVTTTTPAAAPSLALKVTRVGPLFRVITTVKDRDGSLVARFERPVQSGALLGSLLLGPDVARALQRAAPSLAVAAPPAVVSEAAAAAASDTHPTSMLSWSLLAGGAGLGAAGAALVAVGSVGAAHEAWVLSDRVSLGVAKARARMVGPGLLAAAGVGVALTLGGAVIAGAALVVE